MCTCDFLLSAFDMVDIDESPMHYVNIYILSNNSNVYRMKESVIVVWPFIPKKKKPFEEGFHI